MWAGLDSSVFLFFTSAISLPPRSPFQYSATGFSDGVQVVKCVLEFYRVCTVYNNFHQRLTVVAKLYNPLVAEIEC